MPTIPCRPAARRRLAARLSAMALAIAAGAAGAYSVEQNIAFSVVNQNPWAAGNAFTSSWEYNDLRAGLTIPVPGINLSPAAALGEFIGLPEVGFARLQGEISGQMGLNLGYYVDGGRMNVQYPGTGLIDVRTRAADNVIYTVGSTRVDTGFSNGLRRDFVVADASLRALGGAGYDPGRTIPGYESGRFREANFQTYFPNAAAWAKFDWDASAGLKAQAGVLRVRDPFSGDIACIGCVQKSFSVRSADSLTLLDVNRNGVEVIGLGRQALFGQDIALGGGSVRVDYPDVAVRGSLTGAGRLTGGDAKPIISLNGDLEKLVPFAGAFLKQEIGPFGVTLLGVAGGPKLSLYQDFTVDVKPQVELAFSVPVRWRRADGSSTVTQTIRVASGESFDWTPIVNGISGRVVVQPRYILEGTVRNQTGFAIGYEVDVDALEVDAGFGTLGPLDVAELRNDAAIKLGPFFDSSFELSRTSVYTKSFELQAKSPIFKDGVEVGAGTLYVNGATPFDGGFLLDLGINDSPYLAFVQGRLEYLPSLGRDGPLQQLLVMDRELVVTDLLGQQHHFGDTLCLQCIDEGALLADASPSFADGADLLYVNALAEGMFRTDEANLLAPELNRSTTALGAVLQPEVVVGESIASGDFGFGPITPVPEPASGVLMLAGVAALVARRRRR